MNKGSFSENTKINFYENYFSFDDYDTFRYDVGSFCTRKIIISNISKKTGNLLEIGTGIASLIEDLQNFECTGIDFSEKNIAFLKSLYSKKNIKSQLYQADAQSLPFANNFFDVIISSHTLEHIPNDGLVIKECERILKPGGELIFFVPGRISGLATQEEFSKYGHYRYYNLKNFKKLENLTSPKLKITKILYPHKMHNLIWNRLKKFVRYSNYPIKKFILKDNKTYEIRPTYQKLFLPIISKFLDNLDKLTMNSEKNFFGTEFNVLVKFEKIRL